MRTDPGKPFDRDVTFRIADQILNGVFELHSQGIVHRDLKPDNVFLQRRQTAGSDAAVKILDCGLAFKDTTKNDGQLQGTPKYMSPEQCRGELVSAQTDIYAIALIICEMLLGRLPFDVKREGVKEWMEAHQWMTPTALADHLDWISPATSDLILSALAKDPNKRPRSALEFQKKLFLEARRLRDGLPPEISSDANITTPTPMDFSAEAVSVDGLNDTERLTAEPPHPARKETLRMEVAPTHPAVGNVWQPALQADYGAAGADSFAVASPVPAVAPPLHRTPDPRLAPSPVAASVPITPPQPAGPLAVDIRAAPWPSVAAQSNYTAARASVLRTSTSGTAQSVTHDRPDEPSVEMRRDIRRKVLIRSTVLMSGLTLCGALVMAVVRVVSVPPARPTAPTASVVIAPTMPPPPSTVPTITATAPTAPSTTAATNPSVTAAPPPAVGNGPAAVAATATSPPLATTAAPSPSRTQPVVRGTSPARPKSTTADGFQELWR
jgi:serine/threonine-protein kinase